MTNKPSSLPSTEENKVSPTFPLMKINFILMACAAVVIVVGFLLMLGSPSGKEFNPDIFSVRRVVVGPTIALLGFIFMGFGIIYKGKK